MGTISDKLGRAQLFTSSTAVRVTLMICLICSLPALAQSPLFQETFAVTVQNPVRLEVELTKGDLRITYSHEGEVSIAAIYADARPTQCTFERPTIEQYENRFTIRDAGGESCHDATNRIRYRIEVPYRTEVNAAVKSGTQMISGIMGPVKVSTEKGDINISYVSGRVQAWAESGNLDLQVIGEHAEALTHRGNISCTRVAQGVTAETDDGDIALMVVGPSTARVKKGPGKIEAGGLRGSFVGSTETGELHIKAIPHDNWQVNSVSGNIQLELPPGGGFELDAWTEAGELEVLRDDVPKRSDGVQHVHQTVNGGGKRVDVHTDSGRIAIR